MDPMNPPVVNAAVLTGLVALAVALISGLVALAIALITRSAQSELSALAHANTKELSRIQAEQAATEERLRSQLARELATHESSLRIRAETRLRLFERSVRTTERALTIIHRGMRIALDAASRAERRERKADPDAVKVMKGMIDRTFEQLFAQSTFLPPELDDGFVSARERVYAAAKAAAHAIETDGRHEPVRDAVAQMKTAIFGFEESAREWKRRNWSQFALDPEQAQVATDAS